MRDLAGLLLLPPHKHEIIIMSDASTTLTAMPVKTIRGVWRIREFRDGNTLCKGACTLVWQASFQAPGSEEGRVRIVHEPGPPRPARTGKLKMKGFVEEPNKGTLEYTGCNDG